MTDEERARDAELRAENKGRSVHMDGAEIALASDPVAAEMIALCINYIGLAPQYMPREVDHRLQEIFQ